MNNKIKTALVACYCATKQKYNVMVNLMIQHAIISLYNFLLRLCHRSIFSKHIYKLEEEWRMFGGNAELCLFFR